MSLEWQYRIQIWSLQRKGDEIKLEQAQRRATMVTGGTESLPYGRRQETWLVHLGKQKLKGVGVLFVIHQRNKSPGGEKPLR